MTDPFFEQAAVARERYVSFFRQTITQLGSAPNLAVELLVKPNGRDTPPPFCLMRIDAIYGSKENPEIQRIADHVDGQDQESFRLAGGLEILQNAFSWEALALDFSSAAFGVGRLRNWLDRWLDPDEIREPDTWGLSGVLHDVAWSCTENHSWQLHLDFGSAPIAALEELLTLLSDAGVKRITLSRHDLDLA
jgi:hypothetical protein